MYIYTVQYSFTVLSVSLPRELNALFNTHTPSLHIPVLRRSSTFLAAEEEYRGALNATPATHNECWLATSRPSWQNVRGPMHELKAEGLSMRYCKVWE